MTEEIKRINIPTITGQEIVNIKTINSMYANDDIKLYDAKGNTYFINVVEIMKFKTDFNSLVFRVKKKKVRKYLEVINEDE